VHLGGTEVSVDSPVPSRSFFELLHTRSIPPMTRVVKLPVRWRYLASAICITHRVRPAGL
jgi:hypothetical protein